MMVEWLMVELNGEMVVKRWMVKLSGERKVEW